MAENVGWTAFWLGCGIHSIVCKWWLSLPIEMGFAAYYGFKVWSER